MHNSSTHVLSNDSREATADEAAVLQAMHALSQACLHASGAEVAALTESAMSYSHSDNRIQTQDEFILALESGASVFRSIELQGVWVQLAGDIALVRHLALYTTFNRGEAGHSHVQVSQVWQRNQGVWRLLLRQACKSAPSI
jgi:hypothetical protein